jgi:hypothetical protein
VPELDPEHHEETDQTRERVPYVVAPYRLSALAPGSPPER